MKSVIAQFQLKGAPVSCERYGNGHINETYLLRTDAPHDYILQKVNRHVFPDIPSLMRNIERVTAYLWQQTPDPRRVLTLVPTLDSGTYYTDPDGEIWRVYEFVTDSLCLDRPENERDLQQSGLAFGTFQNQLAAFPVQTLTEIIPHFHDTVFRMNTFFNVVAEDPMDRAKNAVREIETIREYRNFAGTLCRQIDAGELPIRVTHNDTKTNNILFDRDTLDPLVIIDLDTCMPGLACYDFGDTIRFAACTAEEDEPDEEKMKLDLRLFRAYAEGYLPQMGDVLSEAELNSLATGAAVITLELASRFLGDYLIGDKYFRIDYPDHNLVRARAQLALFRDMMLHMDDMQAIIADCCK